VKRVEVRSKLEDFGCMQTVVQMKDPLTGLQKVLPLNLGEAEDKSAFDRLIYGIILGLSIPIHQD